MFERKTSIIHKRSVELQTRGNCSSNMLTTHKSIAKDFMFQTRRNRITSEKSMSGYLDRKAYPAK